MKKYTCSITLLLLITSCWVYSQQLVYKPINPFFGGDSFNYQQLLASANAQNQFEKENSFDFDQGSDLENFTDSLNRQLLNSLSQGLFQKEFGDQTLSEGTFVFGSLMVEISPSSGGLLINILDTKTGEQTQITIPN
jgi:curli production assembly/transport component CsgF